MDETAASQSLLALKVCKLPLCFWERTLVKSVEISGFAWEWGFDFEPRHKWCFYFERAVTWPRMVFYRTTLLLSPASLWMDFKELTNGVCAWTWLCGTRTNKLPGRKCNHEHKLICCTLNKLWFIWSQNRNSQWQLTCLTTPISNHWWTNHHLIHFN